MIINFLRNHSPFISNGQLEVFFNSQSIGQQDILLGSPVETIINKSWSQTEPLVQAYDKRQVGLVIGGNPVRHPRSLDGRTSGQFFRVNRYPSLTRVADANRELRQTIVRSKAVDRRPLRAVRRHRETDRG